MRRGDLVTVTLQGDYGKPRPALLIQADQFAGTASVVVLLVTTALVDAPLPRLTVEPSPENGLRRASQVMVDKPMTLCSDRIGAAFGRLDDAAMLRVKPLAGAVSRPCRLIFDPVSRTEMGAALLVRVGHLHPANLPFQA